METNLLQQRNQEIASNAFKVTDKNKYNPIVIIIDDKRYQSITINHLMLEINENQVITKKCLTDCLSIFNINHSVNCF